jgi:NTE family protein
MEVFGVFEGGGAKGLAHVGALRALEERGFRFRAVAGTSIGAIIASLIAAGFKSQELFAVRGGTEVGLLSEDLERKLLDAAEYRRICRLRHHLGFLFGNDGGMIGRVGGRILGSLPLTWVAGVLLANFSIVPYALHSRVFRDLWLNAGAVSTIKLRNWLDEVLSEKLGLDEGEVRFRDLPIELRVITTDLTEGDIRLFSKTATPDTPVADAVAASMAYPLFFKPVQIGGSTLVDGGLASNAPAWVLDDLRDGSDVRIPTFAFRLLDTNDAQRAIHDRPLLLWQAVARFIASSFNSRSALETRRIEDFHLIELLTEVSTLDFDAVNKNKAATVDRGVVGVSEYLARKIGPRDPQLMERALRAFIPVVRDLTHSGDTVRSYLIQPIDAANCRVVYSALLEGDADDALVMRSNSRSQAMCLSLREPVLIRISSVPTGDRVSAATKYIHAARPAYVTHVYCCPIFASQNEWCISRPTDRAAPIAALCFDFCSGDDVGLLDPVTEDCIAAVAQVFGEFWTGRVLFQPVLIAGAQVDPPAPDWLGLVGAPGFFISGRKGRSSPPDAMTARLENIVRRIGSD